MIRYLTILLAVGCSATGLDPCPEVAPAPDAGLAPSTDCRPVAAAGCDSVGSCLYFCNGAAPDPACTLLGASGAAAVPYEYSCPYKSLQCVTNYTRCLTSADPNLNEGCWALETCNRQPTVAEVQQTCQALGNNRYYCTWEM